MSALEDFTKSLQDAIAGNKLSSSRVEAVKKTATKCFDRPQLAKQEFLRLHVGAPASSKICSLYLFDAIARHAKDIVRKNGAGQDPKSSLPSIAKAADPLAAFVSAAKEFLAEIADIMPKVVEEAAQTVKSEQKEKVLKVVEIWKKADTFEVDLLNTVARDVKATSSSRSSRPGSQASTSHTGTTRSTTPSAPPPADLQSQLARIGESSSSHSGALAGQGSAITPNGLPANLAALLGANGSSTAQPQSHTAASTQNFMDSLSSLVGNSNAGVTQNAVAPAAAPGPSAAPTFDLSQLTALQQFTQQTQTPEAHQAAAAAQPSSVGPPPAPPGPPPKLSTPIQSGGSDDPTKIWPPAPPSTDASLGDLTTFDPLQFDPTTPANWITLGKQWANTYGGYIPPLPELAMHFLIAHQAAMMQASGMGGGGNMG